MDQAKSGRREGSGGGRGGPARRRLVAFFLAIALVVPVGCHRDRPTTPVILVSIDTLRADHLGVYGYARPTSPHLDAFAADAVLFRRSFSHAPSTLMSHASILTSLLPPHHGASIRNERALPLEATTVTEVLHDLGYATASWNGGIQLDRVYGLNQGFDIYESVRRQSASADSMVDREDRFEHQVEQAEPWIREHAGGPFFVFLHTYEVHHPYSPDQEEMNLFDEGYRGRLPDLVSVDLLKRFGDGTQAVGEGDLEHVIAAYDAEIRSMDLAFGRLVGFLKAIGIYDRALMVVTSDHGEEFGEHGRIGWHSHTLYDELLRVPLLVKLPGQRGGGRAPDGTARGIDVAPTILAALGLKPPAVFEGRNLLAAGDSPTGADLTFASRDLTEPEEETALRSPAWKLVNERLYDLGHDPGEREDVAHAHPETVQELVRRRRAVLESRPRVGSRAAEGSEELNERLRALGYLE